MVMLTRGLLISVAIAGLIPFTVPAQSPSAAAEELVPAAVRTAALLARAGGGRVRLAGSTLTTEDANSRDEVVVIEPVPLAKFKPGEIVMLVRNDCHAATGCLLARRVTESGPGGAVRTESFGRPQATAAHGMDASVLGRVSYAVDLQTGRIRDLRHGDVGREIALAAALAREAARRWKYTGTIRPEIRYSI
jgi:hypothetical protein